MPKSPARPLRQGLTLLVCTGLLAGALSGCDRPAEPESSLEVAARSVQSGALSRDGRWALIGSGHHGGSLWQLNERERLYDWNHKQDSFTLITSASFSPEGRRALTTDERTLVLWNTDTGEAEQYWSSPSEILASSLGPDGRVALLGLGDYRASLYNVSGGGIIRNFHHSDRVSTVALSGDGRYAVSGSDAGTATLWNAETGEPIVSQQHDAPVQLVTLSSSGDLVFSSGRYEQARLWTREGVVWELPLPEERVKRGLRVISARFSEDGAYLLTGMPNGRVFLWDIDNRRLVYRWQLPKRKAWHPTAVSVLDVAFTEDPDRYRALSSEGFVHELTY